MPQLPTPASHWIACLATAAVLCGAAGCQRKQAPAAQPEHETAPAAAGSTAAGAQPATDATDGELPAGTLRAYVWHCADGQKLVMRNLFREQAIAIDFHDGTRRLDLTPSGSGVRYADAVAVFWTKGSTATLERQGAPAVDCEERRAESLVEDARVRGVRIRALGNEPGWVLEIGPADKLSWTTNYGEQRYDFDAARSSAVDGGIAYEAQQGTNSIKATVTVERCVDDGDVEYDRAVSLEFEGQTYRGCGHELTRD